MRGGGVRWPVVLLWLALSGGPAAAAPPGVDLGTLEVAELRAAAAEWVVLDARPRRRWREGHLPGAQSFSWREHTHTDAAGVPYRIHPPAQLAADLGRLGLDPAAPVAVYGDADSSWGGEGWVCWVLAWLGHRGPVRLLAGGVQSWQAAGLPLSRGEPAPRPAASYRVTLRPEVLRSVGQVRAGAGAGFTLVDVRTTGEWLLGRLPGAIHLPWTDLYTGPQRRPLGAAAYRALLERRGVDAEAPLVFYCTGGVRSAYAWTVHTLAGAGPAANLEGGTAAWWGRR